MIIMARATKTTAPAAPTFVARETERTITRKGAVNPEDNPLLTAVQNSLDSGRTLEIPVENAAHARLAVNLLRNAAKHVGAGLSVKEEGDVVIFRAKPTRKARKYTVTEVRAWAEGEGYERDELFPRVAPHVSAAYRDAHGY